jgi:hypothetical protein
VPGATPNRSLGKRLLAAVVAVAFAFGCGGDRGKEEGFDELARQIRELTVPAGSSVEVSSVERTESTARMFWQFETSSSWESYRSPVVDRLIAKGGFHVTRQDGLSVALSRTLPGDVHLVRIEATRTGEVRVTLVAYAW